MTRPLYLNRRDLICAVAAFPLAGIAVAGPNKKRAVYGENGVAIDGTDPVSYFTAGQPIPGDPALSLDWNGATWRFSSETNRAAFNDDPLSFAPQYGGYCAWAVSEGYVASTVPEAWKIVDGKLYLNYSRRIQRRWARDIPARIAAADANWPDVLA